MCLHGYSLPLAEIKRGPLFSTRTPCVLFPTCLLEVLLLAPQSHQARHQERVRSPRVSNLKSCSFLLQAPSQLSSEAQAFASPGLGDQAFSLGPLLSGLLQERLGE